MSTLANLQVLVVEDESLVAMLIEAMLEDAGCDVVGPASRVGEALELLADHAAIDLALLDVNVAGEAVFPVAEALAARNIPFVFSTGYGEGGLPDAWRGRPVVQKPFTEESLRKTLETTAQAITA